MNTLPVTRKATRTLSLLFACCLVFQAAAAENPVLADGPASENDASIVTASSQSEPAPQVAPATAISEDAETHPQQTAIIDTSAAPAPEGSYDPWQKFNRRMHRFNNVLDRRIARPAAQGYVKAVPEPVRRSVSNFFNNVSQSTTMVNALLQGKPKRAGQSLSRLVINSTVGLGGIFDPASKANIPNNSEDFGQTLATWGWKKSRYVELPVLGPTTIRDTVGNGVDSALTSGKGALSPLRNVGSGARLVLDGIAMIDGRSHLLQYDSLRESAPDDYLLLREFWLQHRQYEILDQSEETAAAVLPDYLQQENDQQTSSDNPAETRTNAE
jgi:phospholipid-binding lipoprotein MlaA